MPIEVSSLPNPRRHFSWRHSKSRFASIGRSFHFFQADTSGKQRLLLRSFCGLIAIALIAGGDRLLASYKYHSRIIDARLANGYLTSRPGLYAAPRTLQAGQKISRANLIVALRRAGYVRSEGTNIWSGSFRETESGLWIRPTPIRNRSGLVTVEFDNDGRISALTEEGVPLDQFTLEPEALSNDVSYKSGKREAVRFSEIPLVLVQAILAAEDQRFFSHSGLDPIGIGRALVSNAADDRPKQGGSTITQQLIKNTYLSPERSFKRKYAEAMLAFALERRLSKEDIFALYCHEVYLGQRGAAAVRGVEEAARVYFGKELQNLSLAEAATIAGMIQGPMRFSPTQHNEASRERRNAILAAMKHDGFISAEQAATAANEPLAVTPAVNPNFSLAPYFVDYVTSHTEFGASPEDQRIYTTIDLELQQIAEAALKRQLDRLDNVHKDSDSKLQAALVALDPHTGNVVAMVGGRQYAETQLNRATDARRQPGSTFKPFVYAAALEDGTSPVRTFADSPREFIYDRNQTYRPANFGGGYSMRDVTMRTALVKSLNVVTVDVALQTGLARIANLAESFGLPKPERYPSLALGTKEVTPLELATAYAVFVNGGRRVVPRVISSVGEPPATHGNDRDQLQVIRPTTAYMITNMLAAVTDHGTARAARNALPGVSIAGKTGTSRDGWFVGYTPNLVCVVWIGFDDNQQLGLTGAEAALPAWIEFMRGAVDLKPELGGRNFECPEGIKFVEIDAENGALSTLACPRRELIAVTERLSPNVECLLHGNLPGSVDVGADEVAESENSEIVLSQHVRRSRSNSHDSGSPQFGLTRVEIDGSGRRTLINTMR